ncbi:MAG: hypothetical protein JXR84_24070 [Anaerolineae bacterium]|nr:hypothetical protein [Anaerolineae bacterium]
MSESTIVDTFPAFLAFWEKAQHLPMDAQIEGWASDYMAQWPELLEKQINSYAEDGDDWRDVAREHVVPFWAERLPSMQRAHENLLRVCVPVYQRARAALGFEQALSFVIYVGVGCGAGWATTYQDGSAILFGLENIAEEGWDDVAALSGMIAHEIGHLWHFEQRAQAGLAPGKGPWWDLYTEGVAQRCEHVVAGQESWHMTAKVADWVQWCEQEKSWLAREFLRVVGAGDDIRPFFGSWFSIRGYKQTGYFLGCDVIRRLEAQKTLQEIALLEDIEAVFSGILMRFMLARISKI